MSETINALEHRLSPRRLKQEVKGAVLETLDAVSERYHPLKIANRAGRTMMDTIKDHPVSAAIAGISIGYLLTKGGERSYRRGRDGRRYYEEPRYGDYRRRSSRAAYSSPRYFPEEYYEEPGHGARPSGRAYRSREEKSTGERASETAEEAKERTSEAARDVEERVEEQARRVQERAQRTGRRAKRQARRASDRVEDFVHENPMAAGALAVGVGALLGNLFPSTETEDEWMGPMRDDVADRAGHVARETMEEAKEEAERVGEEIEKSAEDVKETAKKEAAKAEEETEREAERRARR